ncbi:MAG: 50S ribosomal protein L22 [Treponemataceae bacterium]
MAGKEYRSVTKFLIASPTKVRPVANIVKSKPYTEAMAILENTPNKGARLISQTMKSAASNALYADKNLDEDMMFVKDIMVDEGPRLRRIWRRARGRADIQLKRMCHITVILNKKDGE